jgi:hypothetical protein
MDQVDIGVSVGGDGTNIVYLYSCSVFKGDFTFALGNTLICNIYDRDR